MIYAHNHTVELPAQQCSIDLQIVSEGISGQSSIDADHFGQNLPDAFSLTLLTPRHEAEIYDYIRRFLGRRTQRVAALHANHPDNRYGKTDLSSRESCGAAFGRKVLRSVPPTSPSGRRERNNEHLIMKKIFAILIALSALSNFSCKEKEEEYTEGGLVFGGIYMLDGQQLVETDGYILELPAEQNTVELRIVSKGVQEFGIGGYPMSGLGEYKVEGFTIKVTPDPASEKLEIYDYIDVEYKGEQHRVPRYLQTLHLGADTNTGQQKEIRYGSSRTFQTIGWSGAQLTVRQAGR